MTTFLAGILLAFFASCGLVALLYCLLARLFIDRDEQTILLIPADEKSEDLELRLKSAKMQLALLPGGEEKHILVLDNGMSESVRELAFREAADGGNITVVRLNELQKLLKYSKINH